jgi:hypothetical protein
MAGSISAQQDVEKNNLKNIKGPPSPDGML